MQFGVRLPHSGPLASPEALRTIAQRAEELGFAAVLTHDHVNWRLEDKYHFYCGGLELVDGHPRPTEFFDAMETMAYLAGMTTRIHFVAAAIVLAWRHPLALARLALTLHHLSQRRFIMGVCVGNVPGDFDVLGVPWDNRAAIAEEHLEVLMRALRADGPFDFAGQYVRFSGAELRPAAPDLPVWYGGTAPRGLRRAARMCNGLLVGGPPAYLADLGRKTAKLRAEYGRGDEPFALAILGLTGIGETDRDAEEVAARSLQERERAAWMSKARRFFSERDAAHIGGPETLIRRFRAYADAGVSFAGLGFVGHSLADVTERMALFAETVIPAFAPAGSAAAKGAAS
jgi:alkanesulfonate monooxygenase SsuD/methylene tetrahydromethanopterin reductase-like flavin-dependent oxidoreductase (luciferase family)